MISEELNSILMMDTKDLIFLKLKKRWFFSNN
ncbi:hypothetical protein AEQU2_00532 [Aequorivita lipolytica]|nr:hypothetical protein AEQU2_00532 [Aequorivita lipolytica]